MDNKKILIFSTAYLPHTGGAEIAIEKITDRIDDYSFDMITTRLKGSWPKKEKIGNITIHRVGIGWPIVDKLMLAFWSHKKAKELHEKNSYDLIWSMMASYNSFAALSLKEETGLPYLLTLQTGNPLEYVEKKTKLVKDRFKKIFTKADGLQAISNYLLEWGEKMGFSGDVKEIVPNGVDLDTFDIEVSDEEKKKVRNSMNLTQDDFILVTASRLVKKNGVEHVVKALRRLPEDMKFVVCGEGRLQGELIKLAKDFDIQDRIIFLGNVDHSRLVKILHASDVFIRPSLTEGLGNAFLEAMATGTPIIGTMVGGIPDFLEDEKTGFVCEPEDPESIVKTVKKIRGMEKDKLEKITTKAQNLIREKYNWDSIAQSMKSVFNKLCAS